MQTGDGLYFLLAEQENEASDTGRNPHLSKTNPSYSWAQKLFTASANTEYLRASPCAGSLPVTQPKQDEENKWCAEKRDMGVSCSQKGALRQMIFLGG